MTRLDCFAYIHSERMCDALNATYCEFEKCKFYRTRAEQIKKLKEIEELYKIKNFKKIKIINRGIWE